MPIKRALLFVAIALLGAAFSVDARADLSVNVVNKSGVDSSQVFIMFGAAPLQARATINGAPNTPIARGVSYELATNQRYQDNQLPSWQDLRLLEGSAEFGVSKLQQPEPA